MKFEIETTGNRIKFLRKKLRARQQDIAGNGVSRERLSQIENGGTCTKENAEVIASNFNKYKEYHGIDYPDVNVTYILAKKEDQVLDFLKSYVLELNICKFDFYKNRLIETINDIESLFQEYEVGNIEKIETYKFINDILQDGYKWRESIPICYKWSAVALNLNDYEQYILAFIKIIKAESNLEHYEQVEILGNYCLTAMKTRKVNSEYCLKIITFYVAIAYKKLKLYDQCVKLCNKIESEMGLDSNQLCDVKMLIANCYQEEKRYKEAEEIYFDLISNPKFCSDGITIARIYRNISELKYNKGEIDKAEEYVNISLQCDLNKEEDIALSKYFSMLIYIKLNKYEIVFSNFCDTLRAIQGIKDKNKELEMVEQVINYFLEIGNDTYVEHVLNCIEKSVLENRTINEQIHEVFVYAAYHYSKFDSKKSHYYLNKKMELKKYINSKN